MTGLLQLSPASPLLQSIQGYSYTAAAAMHDGSPGLAHDVAVAAALGAELAGRTAHVLSAGAASEQDLALASAWQRQIRAREAVETATKARVAEAAAAGGGVASLQIAAREGDVALVGILLGRGGGAIDSEGSDGRTALMVAASQGHAAVVGALIQAGASVEYCVAAEGVAMGRKAAESAARKRHGAGVFGKLVRERAQIARRQRRAAQTLENAGVAKGAAAELSAQAQQALTTGRELAVTSAEQQVVALERALEVAESGELAEGRK